MKTAKELLGEAIRQFEETHMLPSGFVDLSDDENRTYYKGMVNLLFGNNQTKHKRLT